MVQPGSDNGQESPITAASSSTFPSIFGDKKNMPGDSSKPTFQFGANNGFSAPNMPSIFSASGAQSFSMQTPTLISVNQQPVLSGNQNTAEALGDADEDAEPEQPRIIVHEAKCKVYVKVGKILLNALISKGIKMNVQKNTVASIFQTSDAQSSESGSATVVARTYLFRLKNEEQATKLSATVKENAPSD